MKWKPVIGHESCYEVSDTGIIRKPTGKVIGQWKGQGYMLARLSGPRKTVRVHRVVAEAFIPNPNALPFINHLDCDPSNNKASNLEWCTQWHNLDHSAKLGRMQRNYWCGKRSPNAAIEDDEAEKIRREYARGGISWEGLGKKHGLSKRSVGRIVRGKSYV